MVNYLLYASYFYHKIVAFDVLCHFFWTAAKLRREELGAGTEAKKREKDKVYFIHVHNFMRTF
jgi:hypothetical protein